MVPELEEREAAKFVGYTWKQWATLPRSERVAALAHYRMDGLLRLHAADAAEIERRQRQAKGKRARRR